MTIALPTAVRYWLTQAPTTRVYFANSAHLLFDNKLVSARIQINRILIHALLSAKDYQKVTYDPPMMEAFTPAYY